MNKGHIYVITNLINGKQYVGQTSRDIYVRFDEHCYDASNSAIHKAIEKYGVSNFSLQELETVDLDKLDEREQFWIKELNTYCNGYNKNEGGNQSHQFYNQILIVENNIKIDSCEFFAEELAKVTDWSLTFIKTKIKKVLDTNDTFLGYHIKSIKAYKSDLTDSSELINWMKTLNIRYQGQHIYCLELDKSFETMGECARFLIDNGYYSGTSQQPIQTVISILSNAIKNNIKPEALQNMTFFKAPGTTKKNGILNDPFKSKKVYCPELDLSFESCIEAARYMVNENIWTGIKVKTAQCRISDVVNGIFPHYRNCTFKIINDI